MTLDPDRFAKALPRAFFKHELGDELLDPDFDFEPQWETLSEEGRERFRVGAAAVLAVHEAERKAALPLTITLSNAIEALLACAQWGRADDPAESERFEKLAAELQTICDTGATSEKKVENEEL